MLRWTFQLSVELITNASLKKLLYVLSMVANCVTRVGISCSVVEKKNEFLNCTFFAIFHFFQLLSCQWLGKTYFSLVPPYPVSPLGSEQLTPKVT